jgi:molybdopterin-guanine dinucleotide biosynthesis protein A
VKVAAIVLAGGRSARFGGPKLAADLGGRPLVEHAIAAAREVGDEVVIAVPPDGRLGDAVAIDGPNVRVTPDQEPFGGPLVGLSNALASVTAPVAIVVGGDMPRLHVEVLRAMVAVLAGPRVSATSSARIDIVLLAADDGPSPLPLAVRVEPARVAAAATLAAGDRSLRSFVDHLAARILAEAEWRTLDPDGGTLVDIDRPADLEDLARRANEGSG